MDRRQESAKHSGSSGVSWAVIPRENRAVKTRSPRRSHHRTKEVCLGMILIKHYDEQ